MNNESICLQETVLSKIGAAVSGIAVLLIGMVPLINLFLGMDIKSLGFAGYAFRFVLGSAFFAVCLLIFISSIRHICHASLTIDKHGIRHVRPGVLVGTKVTFIPWNRVEKVLTEGSRAGDYPVALLLDDGIEWDHFGKFGFRDLVMGAILDHIPKERTQPWSAWRVGKCGQDI